MKNIVCVSYDLNHIWTKKASIQSTLNYLDQENMSFAQRHFFRDGGNINHWTIKILFLFLSFKDLEIIIFLYSKILTKFIQT